MVLAARRATGRTYSSPSPAMGRRAPALVCKPLAAPPRRLERLASRRQPRHHLTPREALGAGELLEPRLEGVVETGPLLNAGPSPLDDVPQPVAAPQGVLDEALLGRAEHLVRNSADVRETGIAVREHDLSAQRLDDRRDMASGLVARTCEERRLRPVVVLRLQARSQLIRRDALRLG